jgi:hypothetical protein
VGCTTSKLRAKKQKQTVGGLQAGKCKVRRHVHHRLGAHLAGSRARVPVPVAAADVQAVGKVLNRYRGSITQD